MSQIWFCLQLHCFIQIFRIQAGEGQRNSNVSDIGCLCMTEFCFHVLLAAVINIHGLKDHVKCFQRKWKMPFPQQYIQITDQGKIQSSNVARAVTFPPSVNSFCRWSALGDLPDSPWRKQLQFLLKDGGSGRWHGQRARKEVTCIGSSRLVSTGMKAYVSAYLETLWDVSTPSTVGGSGTWTGLFCQNKELWVSFERQRLLKNNSVSLLLQKEALGLLLTSSKKHHPGYWVLTFFLSQL